MSVKKRKKERRRLVRDVAFELISLHPASCFPATPESHLAAAALLGTVLIISYNAH